MTFSDNSPWTNMGVALVNSVWRFIRPFRLAGPLFDKELRVSSRRRRNYVVRSVYIVFLTFFVAVVWLGLVDYQGSAAYQKSRMEVAGKSIITTIVTFQFVATQLVAIVMLSTAISDEVYHRTLGLLMTTPISSFHIVMGKLFSKLLQIILLLAISLPLLAVVRVFGGVPWGYLLSSLCITVTAVIFAGTLSLYFSIHNRRAYVVIIKTVVVLGVLFLFIPALGGALMGPQLFRTVVLGSPIRMNRFIGLVAVSYLNPFAAMSANTAMMISPTGPMTMPFFYWPAHCLFMLIASGLFIALCVMLVRKTALRQATGQLEFSPKKQLSEKRKKPSLHTHKSRQVTDVIKPVKGSPVLWKELRAPMIQGAGGRNSIIGLIVAIIALFITYGVCRNTNCLDQDFVHIIYVMIFLILGGIFNMVLSASCVTSEKETRSWPILLATSMDDWHILLGKAVGVFRRSLPFWLFLAGHVALFILIRYIHPIALPHLFMLVAGLVVFLTGMGIYFSSRFKHTTSAVVACFGMALFLWTIVPILLGSVAVLTNDENIINAYVSANPAVQTAVILGGAVGKWNARDKLSSLDYNWPNRRWSKFGATTGILFTYMLMYMSVGVFFAWRAKCLFRRRIF